MNKATPPPVNVEPAVEIPWGIIVGCIIGLIVLVAAGVFFNYCCRLYIFYRNVAANRPGASFVFGMTEQNRNLVTMACVCLSQECLSCCCCSLKDVINARNVYQDVNPKPDATVAITQVTSLFKYKAVPAGEHLQAELPGRALNYMV